MNTKVKPECYGEYHLADISKRSRRCFGCYALKDCQANPKGQSGSSIQTSTIQSVQDTGPAIDSQWQSMWSELLNNLHQDSNLIPLIEYMQNFKQQKLGR